MSRFVELTLALGLAAGVLLGCAVGLSLAADDIVLKHDDGSMESKRSMTGGGHAVRFNCPPKFKWHLDRVALFGARYGYDQPPDEDFFIYVSDASMEKSCKIAKPYRLFEKGKEKWYPVEIPAVEVPATFYVCFVFNPTRTKGVYVGMDENVDQSHSKQAVPESHVEVFGKKADWMIRAHLTRRSKGDVLHLLSKEEREQERRAGLADRESRLLKGAKSAELKHHDGPMDAFHSHGGVTAQTVMFEAPEQTPYVYGISFYGSQYGAKHDAEAVNGDVYILDANLRVISRTSFPYSLLTYEKAWIEVPTLPTKVTDKFYVALHAHSEQYKGIYVGYHEGIDASHSSLGRVARGQFTLKPTGKKLEWMIRVKLADRPVYYE